MQQAERIGHAGGAQLLPQVEHLSRRQPELGLVAAAVLPLARAQRRQPHAHADAGFDAQRARFGDHQRQFRRLLDHDEGFEPELATDQRQADVLAVLVAVADDQPARARQRQHRHQFGFAAGLQAEAVAGMRCQRPGDAAVLVDLDRIHRGVAAAVIPVGLRLRERGLQLAQAIAEDVREAHQQRQARAGGARGIDDVGQCDRRAAFPARTHRDAAGRIDIEIALRPMWDRIGLAGKIERPGSHRRIRRQRDAHSSVAIVRSRPARRP